MTHFWITPSSYLLFAFSRGTPLQASFEKLCGKAKLFINESFLDPLQVYTLQKVLGSFLCISTSQNTLVVFFIFSCYST